MKTPIKLVGAALFALALAVPVGAAEVDQREANQQKRIAEDTIADVDASGIWPGKVVTEVAPVGPFWEAEPEHQDYLEKYPDGYTCHFIRPNWTLPHRAETAQSGARGATAA